MNYCSYYILRVKVYNQTFKAADAMCAIYAWAWSFGGSGLQIFVAQKIYLLTICRFLRGINQVSSNYIIMYDIIYIYIIYIIYDVPDYHNPERANGQSVLYADDSENVGQSVHKGFLLVFQRCYFLIDFDKMFVDSAFPMYLGSIFWLWDGRFIMAEIWFSCGKSW